MGYVEKSSISRNQGCWHGEHPAIILYFTILEMIALICPIFKSSERNVIWAELNPQIG